MTEILDTLLKDVLPKLIPIVHYLGVLLVLAGVTWAGTEALATKEGKSGPNARKLRMWLGGISGLLAYGVGFLPTPANLVPLPDYQWVFGFLFAGFTSWLAVLGSERIYRFVKSRKGA